MTSGKRSIGTTPLWLIALLGIATTSFGVYIQATGSSPLAQMVAGTLTGLGGGVIGAAISIYFAAGEGRDALLAVRDLLAGSLRAQMRSTEKDLRPIRLHWHRYHLTQRDGQFVWRHTDYHFEQSNLASSIVVMIKDVSFGRELLYRAEVAVRGDRMILVEAPDHGGSEPPIVDVTPFFTEGYRKVRAGVVLLRSWDGNDLLSKCLWSPVPLVDASPDVPYEDAILLEGLWDEAFRTGTRILPSVHDNPAPAPIQRKDVEAN